MCQLIEDNVITDPITCRDVDSQLLSNNCASVTRAHIESITSLRVDEELDDILADDFSDFINLGDLFINDLNVKELRTNVFQDLSILALLDLSGNNLTTVHADFFSSLSGLVVLDLSDNDFDNLPVGVFSSLSSLRVLYLDSNNLGGINLNDFYSNLNGLEELDLTDNPSLTQANVAVIEAALPNNCEFVHD